jgi:RimJ/RimL family protein N-acetyltransferase
MRGTLPVRAMRPRPLSPTRRSGPAAVQDILTIRPATSGDTRVILDLINEAAEWLRTKGTDQWNAPWPNTEARDARVLRSLRHGSTWIVEKDGSAVATITYRRHGSTVLWTERERGEPAVYVSRLIVTRRAAGRHIGTALSDWAGQRALWDWGAQWVRIDVWTTNEALHNYYEKRGFRFCRVCVVDERTYPSAALFEKPTREVDVAAAARFTEAEVALPDGLKRPRALPQLVAEGRAG